MTAITIGMEGLVEAQDRDEIDFRRSRTACFTTELSIGSSRTTSAGHLLEIRL
ncbi:hypothetical protein SB748_26465 [Rhizobium sp. SIMBA_035]